MRIGYDYRCDVCSNEWLLFSTRLTLGPTLWGETKYTCFSCQTFLSIAKSVDRNSWDVWMNSHAETVRQNSILQQLADSIVERLNETGKLTPIDLNFDSIECPTCAAEQLSAVPFGQHKMKCKPCNEYTGTFVNDNDNDITIYGEIVTDGEDDA